MDYELAQMLELELIKLIAAGVIIDYEIKDVQSQPHQNAQTNI